MKRTLFFLALGLLVMNLTSACNKTDESAPMTNTTTNEVSTNMPATNMPATH